MDEKESTPNDPQVVRSLSLTFALIIGQAGCVTLVIVLLAVAAGLWLDQTFATRPTFTLILILGSIPVSLFTLIYVLRRAMPRLEAVRKTEEHLSEMEVEGQEIGTGNSPTEEER